MRYLCVIYALLLPSIFDFYAATLKALPSWSKYLTIITPKSFKIAKLNTLTEQNNLLIKRTYQVK